METPKAQYIGEIKVPGTDLIIPCAVLDDGTRLLSDRGVTKALGGKRGGSHWRRKKEGADGAALPVDLSAKNLQPFITKDLAHALENPIEYRARKGGAIANGLEAGLLPKVCDVWLKARDAGALLPQQQHIALSADILMRGLAQIGIVALVDEATGYQEVRSKTALQQLLAIYLSEERLQWAKTFPDEFYRQLFRLKGWNYDLISSRKPRVVGKITNQIVYERLPKGVLEKLRELNPVVDKKTFRRAAKHHQHLSVDVGQEDLKNFLLQEIALMRASTSWANFEQNLDRAFPSEEPPIDLIQTSDIK